MSEQEKTHKRRVRYKGKYPKSYKEKYKELQPDKYSDIIEHVIKKGSTPVGMHISICVNEILDFFQIQPGQIGLDATLGYGGHTEEMLKKLNNKGHIYGLDIDPIEILKTEERLRNLGYGPEILTVKQLNFSNIDLVCEESNKFDFVLADLGVSSMQIDNPERGFSYKKDGPLDLRMNPEKGLSAAQRLRDFTQPELEGALIENADEPHAKIISQAIINELKQGNKIQTTSQLREVITKALADLPKNIRDNEIKKSCQRTFQALRIDVNREYQSLYYFLEKLPNVLKPGGKVAILSFHSGEDRLVKKSFKWYLKAGIYKDIAPEVIRPSAKECAINRRASSAKLRWAIKA